MIYIIPHNGTTVHWPYNLETTGSSTANTFIKDLLNAEGSLYTLKELHERNLNIILLERETFKFNYQRMRSTLHETIKGQIYP